MAKVSETAIQTVLRDIKAGNDEHVKQFFAARPDWQDKDDKAGKQTDNQGEKKTEK
jgi:hypothetical protein